MPALATAAPPLLTPPPLTMETELPRRATTRWAWESADRIKTPIRARIANRNMDHLSRCLLVRSDALGISTLIAFCLRWKMRLPQKATPDQTDEDRQLVSENTSALRGAHGVN